MQKKHLLIAMFMLFQACGWQYPKIDIAEAMQPVHLDSSDLTAFSQLKQQLNKDLPAIIKQYETVNNNSQPRWFSTNSYYLNQIDSPRYALYYSRLKGKLKDDIRISKQGSTIFTIKSNVQMNWEKNNESYEHYLISADCNCTSKSIFNNIDTVYIDSVINKDWKYIFHKALTGH